MYNENVFTALSEQEMMDVDGGRRRRRRRRRRRALRSEQRRYRRNHLRTTVSFSPGLNVPSPVPSVSYDNKGNTTTSLNVGVGSVNLTMGPK